MLAFTLSLCLLGLGLTEQVLALHAEPAFKRHPGHPQTLDGLLQKRQGSELPPPPPIPTQCKSRCDPINAILLQGCPISSCCTNAFLEGFAACFLCAAAAEGNTDYRSTQESMNQMVMVCANMGLPIKPVFLPGMEPRTSSSSVSRTTSVTTSSSSTISTSSSAISSTPPPTTSTTSSNTRSTASATLETTSSTTSSSTEAPSLDNFVGDPTPTGTGSPTNPGLPQGSSPADTVLNSDGDAMGESLLWAFYIAFFAFSVNTMFLL